MYNSFKPLMIRAAITAMFILILITYKAFPLLLCSSLDNGMHVDSYVHGLYAKIILKNTHLPTRESNYYEPYFAFPSAFILQDIVHMIVGSPSIIITNNILSVIAYVIVILLLYILYVKLLRFYIVSIINNITSQTTPTLNYINAYIISLFGVAFYVVLYLNLIVFSPPLYSLIILITLFYIILGTIVKSTKMDHSNSIVLLTLFIALVLGHHLTSTIVTFFVFIVMAILALLQKSRFYDLAFPMLVLSITYAIHVWIYDYFSIVTDVYKSSFFTTEKAIQYSTYQILSRLPKYIVISSMIRRSLILLVFLISLISLINKKIIRVRTVEQKHLKIFILIFTLVSIILTLPLLGVALERLFIYPMILLTPFFIIGTNSIVKSIRKKFLYAILIILFALSYLSSFITTYHNLAGPSNVVNVENVIASFIIRYSMSESENINLVCDHYMAEIVHYNIGTFSKPQTIHDQFSWRNEYLKLLTVLSKINNKASESNRLHLYIITSRSLQRLKFLYNIVFVPKQIYSCPNIEMIYNSKYGIVVVK